MSTPAEIEFDEAPTALYRFFDADGDLLYVGITRNLNLRLTQHAADKPWWASVARKTLVWYPSRSDAAHAEGKAIREERPQFNVALPYGT